MTEFRLRGIHDLLLRGNETNPMGVYHLQMATAEQLCRLHYSPTSIKAVKARLKDLVDAGYLQADTIPTKMFRAPYYYTLGKEGVKYLGALGYDMEASWRASKEVDKHAMFVEHTLELNDVLISAALLPRVDSRFSLIEMIHERTLKRHPFKATWHEDGAMQVHRVIPDAFLKIGYRKPDGTRVAWPIIVEHDRGTEEQKYFRRRIRAYIAFMRAGGPQDLFGVNSMTVAFTTFVGQKRVDLMRQWTLRELQMGGNELGGLFKFANLPQPPHPGLTWIDKFWQIPHMEETSALVWAVA